MRRLFFIIKKKYPNFAMVKCWRSFSKVSILERIFIGIQSLGKIWNIWSQRNYRYCNTINLKLNKTFNSLVLLISIVVFSPFISPPLSQAHHQYNVWSVSKKLGLHHLLIFSSNKILFWWQFNCFLMSITEVELFSH